MWTKSLMLSADQLGFTADQLVDLAAYLETCRIQNRVTQSIPLRVTDGGISRSNPPAGQNRILLFYASLVISRLFELP